MILIETKPKKEKQNESVLSKPFLNEPRIRNISESHNNYNNNNGNSINHLENC